MHFFKIILDICLLRGRAQDLPASMNLVWLTAAASVAVNALGMPEPELDLAQWLFIASQAVLFGAAVWILLRLRGFPARWMQTVTALYAVDAVFSLLLLPFLPALMEMIKQGPEIKPGWEAYLLLALSGWLLLIIARILREATEWPLPLAFLAGFATLLAVRILGHLLAPLFGLMV
jgi:heme/copper-type cytochrome/quinol oxidase subunit 3